MTVSDDFTNSALWSNYSGDITFGTSSFDINCVNLIPNPASLKRIGFLKVDSSGNWGFDLTIVFEQPAQYSNGVTHCMVLLTDLENNYFYADLYHFNDYYFKVQFGANNGFSQVTPDVSAIGITSPEVQLSVSFTQTSGAMWGRVNIVNGIYANSATNYYWGGINARGRLYALQINYWDSASVNIPKYHLNYFAGNFSYQATATMLRPTLAFPTVAFSGTFGMYIPGGAGPLRFFFQCSSLLGGTADSLNSIDPMNIDGAGLRAFPGSAAVVKETSGLYKESLYILRKNTGAVQNSPYVIVPLSGGDWYWELTPNKYGIPGFKTQLTLTSVVYNVERTLNLGIYPVISSVISLISNGIVVTDKYLIKADYINNDIKLTKSTAGTDATLLINVYAVT